VGEGRILNGSISPDLTELSNAENILYAFISNGEVPYVGKTIQPLKKCTVTGNLDLLETPISKGIG
jgi:hypothetical protein